MFTIINNNRFLYNIYEKFKKLFFLFMISSYLFMVKTSNHGIGATESI